MWFYVTHPNMGVFNMLQTALNVAIDQFPNGDEACAVNLDSAYDVVSFDAFCKMYLQDRYHGIKINGNVIEIMEG